MHASRVSDHLADTAYHEAGHAISAVAWVGNVVKVSIEPTSEYLGVCKTYSGGFLNRPESLAENMNYAKQRGDVATHEWLQASLLGHARYSLAGYCAQSMFGARLPRVICLAVDEVRDGWERVRLAEGFSVRAVPSRTLAMRERAAHFRAVVREERRTRSFLRAHQAHVEAVARALLKHTTLDEEHFYAVVDLLPPIVPPNYRTSAPRRQAGP